ncbi:MAG TPA: hypothetical protein VGX48_10705 [Pyrinomonadaceae bacterium]|nr:hypothetical protein [Pyrinomonadaceae bacterium]
MLVPLLRLLVVEADARHVERRERVRLLGPRHPVVVRVPPEPQAGEDRVVGVNGIGLF